MPIAMEPGRRMRIVLETDKSKPRDEQPVFFLKYLTVRQWRKISDAYEEIDTRLSGKDALDNFIDTLKSGLLGWENVKDENGNIIEYDPGKIPDILIMTEIMQLLKALVAQDWELEDKKKLESQSPSDSVNSASPAKVQ